MHNRTMETIPTYGRIRTRSSTREQWRRDRPTDQSEHGHRQENNGGETDLPTNQNTVIDKTTMDARPTYAQAEHGHRPENNGGRTDLRTNLNTVIDKRTMEAGPSYGPLRTRSSTAAHYILGQHCQLVLSHQVCHRHIAASNPFKIRTKVYQRQIGLNDYMEVETLTSFMFYYL